MEIKDISLETLALISGKGLSKRAINICKMANIDSLNKILEYYRKYGTFLRILSCGHLTNFQLINICNLYPNGAESVSGDLLFEMNQNKIFKNKKKQSKSQLSIKEYREEIKAFSLEHRKVVSNNSLIIEKIKSIDLKEERLNELTKNLNSSSTEKIKSKKNLKKISKKTNLINDSNVLKSYNKFQKNDNLNIIREIRYELGMTQIQFARAAGFNKVQQISGLENKQRGIGLNLLDKIVKSLKLNDIDASFSVIIKINNKKIKIQ